MQNDLGIPDIFFVVVPIIAGTLFCGGALLFRRHGREMREHGVGTRATVLKKSKKGSGLENGYALLAYTDNTGRQIQAEVWVHSRTWHGLKEGGQTDICYVHGQAGGDLTGPHVRAEADRFYYAVLRLRGRGDGVAGALATSADADEG